MTIERRFLFRGALLTAVLLIIIVIAPFIFLKTSFDGGYFLFYNNSEYGPYRGSIIADSHLMVGFDYPGLSFRSFSDAGEKIITLRVSVHLMVFVYSLSAVCIISIRLTDSKRLLENEGVPR